MTASLVLLLWISGLVVPMFLGSAAATSTVVYALIVVMVSHWGFRGPALRTTRLLLLGFAAVLPILAFLTTWQAYAMGNPQLPYLAGSDGEGYFSQALLVSSEWQRGRSVELVTNYQVFQRILAGLFAVTGPSLYVAQLFNVLVLVVAIAVLGRAADLLGLGSRAVFWTVALFMLTTRFLFYALVLLKEPLLALAVALLVYAASVEARSRGGRFGAYAGVVLAVVLFGTLRLPMLVLVPLVVLSLGWRAVTRGWRPIAVGIAVLILFGGLFARMTTYELSLDAFQRTFAENSLLDVALSAQPQADGSVIGTVLRGYQTWPLSRRIVVLPVAVGIQHLMPPNVWSTAFLTDHFVVFFNVNGNAVWLVWVGLAVAYAGIFWRDISVPVMRRLCVIGWLMTIAMAFVFGGVVPRYASPYLVLIYPAAGLCLSSRRQPRVRRRLRMLGAVMALGALLGVMALILFKTVAGA